MLNGPCNKQNSEAPHNTQRNSVLAQVFFAKVFLQFVVAQDCHSTAHS